MAALLVVKNAHAPKYAPRFFPYSANRLYVHFSAGIRNVGTGTIIVQSTDIYSNGSSGINIDCHLQTLFNMVMFMVTSRPVLLLKLIILLL
jgi:hypothetical protein